MRFALLAFLAACGLDPPELGRVYKCVSVFVCDNVRYEVTPSVGCWGDDPLERYGEQLEELVKDVLCESYYFESTCRETGERCFYE